MSTKARINPTMVVIVALGVATAIFVGPRLSSNNPDDRFITLATAWGTGQGATGPAYMVWHVGGQTDHEIRGGGHWEKVVAAKKGDHVILTGTTSNADPLSCSITQSHGSAITGMNRCEILALP